MEFISRYGHHILIAAAIALLVTGRTIPAVIAFAAGLAYAIWQFLQRDDLGED